MGSVLSAPDLHAPDGKMLDAAMMSTPIQRKHVRSEKGECNDCIKRACER